MALCQLLKTAKEMSEIHIAFEFTINFMGMGLETPISRARITAMWSPSRTDKETRHPSSRQRLCGLFLLAVGNFCLCTPLQAHASHLRFGQVTWTRVGSGNEVSITALEAYRSSFIGSNVDSLGDGNSFSTAGAKVIATGTDIVGEARTLIRTVVSHTYPDEGPFLVHFTSCCRIFELINAGGASIALETMVDLRDGNLGSPVPSIDPIVQFTAGQIDRFHLPISDPRGDPLFVLHATSAESGIPVIAAPDFTTVEVWTRSKLTTFAEL